MQYIFYFILIWNVNKLAKGHWTENERAQIKKWCKLVGGFGAKSCTTNGHKQCLGVFKIVLLSNRRMGQSFLYSAHRYCERVNNHTSLGCEYTPKDERTWFQNWTWDSRTCGRSIQQPDRYDSSRWHCLVSMLCIGYEQKGRGKHADIMCICYLKVDLLSL